MHFLSVSLFFPHAEQGAEGAAAGAAAGTFVVGAGAGAGVAIRAMPPKGLPSFLSADPLSEIERSCSAAAAVSFSLVDDAMVVL